MAIRGKTRSTWSLDSGPTTSRRRPTRRRSKSSARRRLSPEFHNYDDVSAADASRLAALLVSQMHWAFFFLAPCDPGASTPEYIIAIVKRRT